MSPVGPSRPFTARQHHGSYARETTDIAPHLSGHKGSMLLKKSARSTNTAEESRHVGRLHLPSCSMLSQALSA